MAGPAQGRGASIGGVFTYTNDLNPPVDPLPKHMKYRFKVIDGVNVDPILVGVGVLGPDLDEEDDD